MTKIYYFNDKPHFFKSFSTWNKTIDLIIAELKNLHTTLNMYITFYNQKLYILKENYY